MKKLTSILLILVLSISLCACTKSAGGSGKNVATATDLSQAEINRLLEEMEAAEAK